MPLTIVVTEKSIHPDAAALLKDHRVVYTGGDKLGEDELCAFVEREQPDAILARYGIFTRRVLSSSRRLKIVARHGVGMDAIDMAAARELGIAALPATGSNSQAVAEHALGMMLVLARNLNGLDARMKAGHWDKIGYQGLELSGATLGIVGCGSIGGRVARFALAIGMKVLVNDPYLVQADLPEGAQLVSLEDVLARGDVVSLHCPLDDSTRNLLDADRIARLRPGTIVINCARAGMLDEAAMQARLKAGELRLGLDCFVEEPLSPDAAWLTTPNTVLTPHVGGTTNGGLRGMAVGAAQNILGHFAKA